MKQILIQAAGHALYAAALFATSSTALAQSAQDFVNKVAISDMFEIQSSQLALSKQADEDTKPFAQKMVQDHQKTSSELKAVMEGSMEGDVRSPAFDLILKARQFVSSSSISAITNHRGLSNSDQPPWGPRSFQVLSMSSTSSRVRPSCRTGFDTSTSLYSANCEP
jgi:putative membrane protein